jgi:hypothetical protein
MTSFYTSTWIHICNLSNWNKPIIYLTNGSNYTTHIPVYQLYTVLSLFSWIDKISTSDGEEQMELYEFIELFNLYTSTTFII